MGEDDLPPKLFHTVKTDDTLYILHPTRGRARRLWDGRLRKGGRWCLWQISTLGRGGVEP